MSEVTDKMRVDTLGGGMAKQAAMAKMLRQRQLDAAIEQASMGQPPQMTAPPAQMPVQGATMSQPEFSGYGTGGRAPQTPQQQLQLQELLRRQQMLP